MSNALVSIYVPTYNHENYITRALDSILMQKTQYSYEVFVGEDCSTDRTREVLQQWEQAHPGVFTILYREKNMGGLGQGNLDDLKSRCKGKYIIGLEGDDFWTDECKLEKQVAFLESHPEYVAVAHRCVVVGADDQPNGESYPECKDTEYTFRHFASDILPGQFTTMLARNYMYSESIDNWLMLRPEGPGDRRLYFTMLCHGKVYCMQEVMSAYRHITNGGSSFSAYHKYDYKEEEQNLRVILEYAYCLGNRDAIRYTEMLYLRNTRYALRKKLADRHVILQDRKRIVNRGRAAVLLLKRDINYRLLHRTLHV